MTELFLTRDALADLDALPPRLAEDVASTIDALLLDPESVGKQLRGRLSGLWVARVGSYRVLYTIEASSRRGARVIVRAVRHRSVWSQLTRRRPQIERDAVRERRRIDDEFELDSVAGMTVRLDYAGLVIRPFAPDDEDAVVALWEAAGLTRPWNDPRKDIARKLRVQPEWFLVAIAGAEIVGSVMAG